MNKVMSKASPLKLAPAQVSSDSPALFLPCKIGKMKWDVTPFQYQLLRWNKLLLLDLVSLHTPTKIVEYRDRFLMKPNFKN